MSTFFTWLGSKLTPEWRSWWKLRSIQLGILATAVLTYLAATPDAWTKFVAMLPKPVADTIPAWVGTVAAVVIFFARFWKQNGADLTNAVQNPTLDNVTTAANEVKTGIADVKQVIDNGHG